MMDATAVDAGPLTCPHGLYFACPDCYRETEPARLRAEAEAMGQGLREMAEFLAQHPEVPRPLMSLNALYAFALTKDEMAAAARAGSWRKAYAGDWFSLTRVFSGGIRLEVNINRAAACERIVVGTKVVPAVPEHTVDVVEWKCDGNLLGEVP